MTARYRPQARADLYEVYGVSLAEIVYERRWVELVDLLSQLPQASRFWAAVVDDDEYAEQVAEAYLYRDDDEDEPPSWAPPFRDYTAMYQLTTQIYDAVSNLTYTTAKVNGAKAKKPKPFPTPRTAIDEAKSKAQRQAGNGLLDKLTGGRRSMDFDTRVVANDQHEDEPAFSHEDDEQT